MHRSTMIVLAKPAVPLSPEAKLRPAPAMHWRRWRNGGAALSALLHVAVIAGLTISLPVFGGPAVPEPETALPVEIVPRAPETKPEEKAEETKPEEKKPEPPDAKKIPDPVLLEPPAEKKIPEPVNPEPPKPESTPPSPAAKTSPPPPPAAAPKAAPPAPSTFPPTLPAEPAPPAPAGPPPPSFLPEARLPPAPPPTPEATPLRPGTKVDADDDAPPPLNRNAFGHWVLEPVTVNLGHKCGLARITGVLELKERVAEGRYRGTMRTRIAWTVCPAEGVVREVELRIKGGEVEMVGSGFIDRGVIGANTMMLEDAFGRSVWKKR
jgi:hypothetical protein